MEEDEERGKKEKIIVAYVSSFAERKRGISPLNVNARYSAVHGTRCPILSGARGFHVLDSRQKARRREPPLLLTPAESITGKSTLKINERK